MEDLNIFESLHKVLVLETRKGFKDTVVIGGLDAFVSTHLAQPDTWTDSPVRHSIEALWLREGSYRALDASRREQRVQLMLALIDPPRHFSGRRYAAQDRN